MVVVSGNNTGNMYTIEIHQRINQIITVFNRFGMWSESDETIFRKTVRLTYFIFYVFFPISLAVGSFLSDYSNETVFLINLSIICATHTVKLTYILWKKEEVSALLQGLGVHSIADGEKFTQVDKNVNSFMKFASVIIVNIFMGFVLLSLIFPIFSSEKILPLNIWFPLDWKNSKIAYGIAYAYIAACLVISVIAASFGIVMWYLMMNCSIKYKILGDQFRVLGAAKTTRKTIKFSEFEKQQLFFRELIGLIEDHRRIQETTDRFKLCFSKLFVTQITTSGLAICGSVVSFNSHDNLVQSALYIVALIYNIFDIFMVMYFGNEIKLSSDELFYCLFESNWIEQSKSCKKCILFSSLKLVEPHELKIVKLYPLNLKTFTSILNLAYSVFNIVQRF